MTTDIFGKAFYDYLEGKKNEKIEVDINIGEKSYIPVVYFFRDYRHMHEGEQKVMDACEGSVLDVGAGAGSHSLYLQNKGCDVMAIDFSEGVADVIKKRGVKKTFCIDFFDFDKGSFDNILFMMNGAGIAGTLQGLSLMLSKAGNLLNDGGCVYIESTDILYMYEEDDGSCRIDLSGDYYGEVIYRLKYRGLIGKPFGWVFIDRNNLSAIAEECGFISEMVYDTGDLNYIMKLNLKS